MKIFLTVLAVIGAVLVLLLLFLIFGKAKLRVIYRNEVKVFLYVLGIRFRIYPEKTLKPDSKAAKKRAMKKRERKRKRQLQKARDQAAGNPTPNLVENIQMILGILKTAYKKARGKMILRVRRFRIRVATGDAATTAILYGHVLTAATLLFQWINSCVNPIKRAQDAMQVYPDFLSCKSDAEVDIEIGVRLLRGIRIGISLLSSFRSEKAKTVRRAKKRLAKKQAAKKA